MDDPLPLPPPSPCRGRRAPRATALLALLLLALPLGAACDGGGGDAADTSAAPDTSAPGDDTGGTTEPDAFVDDTPRAFVNGASGAIGHITDGDTLDVCMGVVAPTCYTVRLAGINAPECDKRQLPPDWRYGCYKDDEFYGLAAYVGLKELAAGKAVTIACDDTALGAPCQKDVYDRFLAYLRIDGADVATELAWRGYAWSYTTFPSSERAALCAAEYDARNNHRGMWSAGTWQSVIAKMSEHTQAYYTRYHDKDCNRALGR